MPPDLTKLESRLPAIRAHLETCWAFSKARLIQSPFTRRVWTTRLYCGSAGFCRHTSLFLHRLLRRGGDGTWPCAGGEAFDHLDGRYRQHWWLEREGLILDLTADQFDGCQIVLCEATHPDYRRRADLSTWRHISAVESIVTQWEGVGSGRGVSPETLSLLAAGYATLLPHGTIWPPARERGPLSLDCHPDHGVTGRAQ